MIDLHLQISENIIKSAFFLFKKPMIAWTGGKDSTLLLFLIRHLKYKLPAIFLDSGEEFQEVLDFVNFYEKEWNLELHRFHYEKPFYEGKIKGLREAIENLQPDALFVGIRWDEHKARSKETYFSPRQDHMRIHPFLHFKEEEIWEAIKKLKVPYCTLYEKGYRSLGARPLTRKGGKKERSGRDAEKEAIMERLRSLGYF